MTKKASGEIKSVAEKLNFPKCVENGFWAAIPVPLPAGPLMLKLKDVDADPVWAGAFTMGPPLSHS